MTPTTTTTTNTKTVFQKAPFRVLATLLLIQGVMIGQVLLRPAAAKPGASEDCTKISVEPQRTACWLKKAKAGDKNLRDSWLNGVNLNNADLSHADMTATRAVKAYLGNANLTGTNLGLAHLEKADLRQANMIGADLRGANLTGANLNRAKLHNADLRGANLTGASLNGADLTGIKKDKDTKGL
ncbi:pentapeptide repeat-containing protein [Armatimonas sp.]|uniref:pentapeptide repeat-containing protein n=1 Tax=Armatimonas sp. TaxID=1872638 RepID=UPI003752FDBE